MAAELADRIAVLYGGRLAEIGPAAEVLHRPCHPYTVALMAARLMVRAAREHDAASLERIVFAVHGDEAERAFAAAAGDGPD